MKYLRSTTLGFEDIEIKKSELVAKTQFICKGIEFLSQILIFLFLYNLTIRFPRPLIFQTINSIRSNSLSLKYQRFTPSGCKDKGVRKYEFVAKTQFLCKTN